MQKVLGLVVSEEACGLYVIAIPRVTAVVIPDGASCEVSVLRVPAHDAPKGECVDVGLIRVPKGDCMFEPLAKWSQSALSFETMPDARSLVKRYFAEDLEPAAASTDEMGGPCGPAPAVSRDLERRTRLRARIEQQNQSLEESLFQAGFETGMEDFADPSEDEAPPRDFFCSMIWGAPKPPRNDPYADEMRRLRGPSAAQQPARNVSYGGPTFGGGRGSKTTSSMPMGSNQCPSPQDMMLTVMWHQRQKKQGGGRDEDDDDDEDDGVGLSSLTKGAKALRAVENQRQRPLTHPKKVSQEYVKYAMDLLGARPVNRWQLWETTPEIPWGRMRGLYRCHFHGSHILALMMSGQHAEAEASLCAFLRALHQTAIDEGNWSTTHMMLPVRDPFFKEEFGGTQQQLEAIHASKDAVSKLRAMQKRPPNKDVPPGTEPPKVDPKGKGKKDKEGEEQ